MAIQFHLEVTLKDARCWLALETPEPARTVQAAAEILRDPARFDLNNELMIRLLQGIEALA